ncbi:hypothetical protein EHQ59_04005 [Leptospira kemamanensis]|uniref:Uncharacterized protein n=1 Tax=Leptospira kemamanensis TaxID=2484942 RepID=A0A4R9JUM4_9LEPT|nr:hypothetical protein [Leptospira kemamanensis]TGL55579.1 hypothetical protein EHQ59_04005 [Leptospira kemamanensis]
MNSKNHKKWEELLNDSNFESRIVTGTQTRIRNYKRKRNLVFSISATILVLITFSFYQWVIEPNEMVNNMSDLVEELSSESIVSLSFD